MAKIGSKLQKLQVYRVNKRYLCSNQRATGFTLSEPAGSRAVYLSNFTKFFLKCIGFLSPPWISSADPAEHSDCFDDLFKFISIDSEPMSRFIND
jgi:hypothetical protein